MRLFVAVDLDEALKRTVASAVDHLRRELERAADGGSRLHASWVAPANLHMTLRFLGEVDEQVGRRLRDGFIAPIAQPCFELEIAGAGAFPPSGPVRVVWLGITRGAEALAILHREVEARLEGFGFAPERPFRAHLTVARVKGPAPRAVRDAIGRGVARSLGRCRIDHVTLYESRLSPKGPTYTSLARAPLMESG